MKVSQTPFILLIGILVLVNVGAFVTWREQRAEIEDLRRDRALFNSAAYLYSKQVRVLEEMSVNCLWFTNVSQLKLMLLSPNLIRLDGKYADGSFMYWEPNR